jgi:hypothetical protein
MCEPGSTCSGTAGTQGTCVALGDEGESCDSSLLLGCLRLDNFCDPAEGICKKRLDVGATCTERADCTTFLCDECAFYAYCSGGACKMRPSVGEACTDASGCFFNATCKDGKCESLESEPVCP